MMLWSLMLRDYEPVSWSFDFEVNKQQELKGQTFARDLSKFERNVNIYLKQFCFSKYHIFTVPPSFFLLGSRTVPRRTFPRETLPRRTYPRRTLPPWTLPRRTFLRPDTSPMTTSPTGISPTDTSPKDISPTRHIADGDFPDQINFFYPLFDCNKFLHCNFYVHIK